MTDLSPGIDSTTAHSHIKLDISVVLTIISS